MLNCCISLDNLRNVLFRMNSFIFYKCILVFLGNTMVEISVKIKVPTKEDVKKLMETWKKLIETLIAEFPASIEIKVEKEEVKEI